MKTRFAPSPTGFIHMGNARTALFSALAAKGAKGEQGCFLLRIEDTDAERSEERFELALMADLQWLGADWQEGPDHQSQRQAIYQRYYDLLIAQGKAYPCFCSESELALNRKIQRTQGQAPRYSGKCRHLTTEQIAEKQAAGQPAVLRFRVPDGERIEFTDLVHGEQTFQGDDIGDFIIRRGNGSSSFMFCNAIDDALMGVTHVLRGDDHMTNTPRQLWILRALALTEPQYGHISLIVGPDGSPLSKRHGSKSVQALREMGYLPLAVVNYLARLGHYYQRNDLMSFAELADDFSFENLGRAPARFDEQQLHHWQKEALQACSDEDLWEWLGDDAKSLIPEEKRQLFLQEIRGLVKFPEQALSWAQRFFVEQLAFSEPQKEQLQEAGAAFFAQAQNLWQRDARQWLNAIKETTGVKGKALFQPLRMALTASEHGPDMSVLNQLLGEDTIKQRLAQAAGAV